MKDWYKDWFNTPDYLNVYKHRDDSDAKKLVELILQVVQNKNGSVLDLACGNGRHSLFLAVMGYSVIGIDLSHNLLKIAKANAKERELDAFFINTDVRTVSIKKKFDLVINLFTSFGYFEEDEQNFEVFKIAYEHLKQTGEFVFDYINKSYIEQNLVPYSETNYLDFVLKQHRSFINNFLVKKIEIIKPHATEVYYERVKLYTFDQIKEALTNIGFNISKSFGDYKGSSYKEKESERIILLCSK